MIDCARVLRELSNFIDDDIDPALHASMEGHLRRCRGCSAAHDRTRQILQIFRNPETFPIPSGYSERLHKCLMERMNAGGAHKNQRP
jgi:hypothetical protein